MTGEELTKYLSKCIKTCYLGEHREHLLQEKMTKTFLLLAGKLLGLVAESSEDVTFTFTIIPKLSLVWPWASFWGSGDSSSISLRGWV